MSAYVYILECADGRFYVGITRGNLKTRVAEHDEGTFGGYTNSRRPVRLVYSERFDSITDAIAAERQLKGWSRAKKIALIHGDVAALREVSRNRTEHPHPSTGSG
ncbi:MAG: GIY-YIG nuclease family protein [Proteobacteria bacterium]|nr:GIY-YIG nuclease family protein [Pseudomonadota bacterium]